MNVFENLTARLDQCGVTYEVMRHEAVFTSEQAAEVRGTSLASGAKALICKADDEFRMFVLPADRKLASKSVRKAADIKKLRFASGEEVLALTQLKPGSIPPFGSLFQLPTYCDQGLAEHTHINFNAGDHCISVSLSFADYVQVESPEMGQFAE